MLKFSIRSSAFVGSYSGRTIEFDPATIVPMPVPVPEMWKHGIASSVTSPGIGSCHVRISSAACVASRLERIEPWVMTAPLGLPVVPEV